MQQTLRRCDYIIETKFINLQQRLTLTPTVKKDDYELIALCQAQNDLGFTELYQRYARRVYNSIYRIVSDQAEAEDILQETFLTAFREIDKLSGVSSFEAWVKRVGINKSISHLRKRKIQFTELAYTELEAEPEYDGRENEIFENKVEDVKNCINQLPHSYKTIVCLYLFENIPQEEIANMLGLTHTNVRSQYHRAKKKILLSLKDKTYHE